MVMYNLSEYSLNYSDATGSLWYYSKRGAANFNAYIANDNNFKSFRSRAKLLGNTETDEVNGIFRNTTIAVTFKHLSDFW